MMTSLEKSTAVLRDEALPGGGNLSFILKRGQILRMTDIEGGANVSLMMLNNRLARIDVYKSGVRTVSGAGIGTSESDLKRLYGGKLVQEAHAYTGPEGHYLTLRSAGGRYGVRFETDGVLVTGFYAGTAEAIQYIEGCQ